MNPGQTPVPLDSMTNQQVKANMLKSQSVILGKKRLFQREPEKSKPAFMILTQKYSLADRYMKRQEGNIKYSRDPVISANQINNRKLHLIPKCYRSKKIKN